MVERKKRGKLNQQKARQEAPGKRYLVFGGTSVEEVDEVGFAIAEVRNGSKRFTPPAIPLLPSHSPKVEVVTPVDVIETPQIQETNRELVGGFAKEVMNYTNKQLAHPLLETLAQKTALTSDTPDPAIRLTPAEIQQLIHSREFSAQEFDEALAEGYKRLDRDSRVRILASYPKF